MADDVLCAVKVVLCVPGCPHREALYDLRPGVPLCEHIASLFGNFFSSRDELEPRQQDPNNCALWTPHGHFLTDEEWEAGLPLKQSWVVEGCTLEFRLSPRHEAGTIVSRLKQGDVKAAVHELKTSLMQLHFAEAFIERGGVAALLQIATEQAGRPATQAYALQALRTATCWELGTQKLLKAGGAVKLVRLLHSDSLRAVGAALELLAALCARADGFKIVHSAVLSVARERGEQSYARLVTQLVGDCDDLDVKTCALLLVNQLVCSTPDKKAKERLLLKLKRRLGLDRQLSSQLHVQHSAFVRQLESYQEVSGSHIPGSYREASLYRAKCERMAAELHRLREDLQAHEMGQPMVSLMLHEVLRLREAARHATIQAPQAINNNDTVTSRSGRESQAEVHQILPALAEADLEHAEAQAAAFDAAQRKVQELQADLSLIADADRQKQERLVSLQAQLNMVRGVGGVSSWNASSNFASLFKQASTTGFGSNALGMVSPGPPGVAPPMLPPPPPPPIPPPFMMTPPKPSSAPGAPPLPGTGPKLKPTKPVHAPTSPPSHTPHTHTHHIHARARQRARARAHTHTHTPLSCTDAFALAVCPPQAQDEAAFLEADHT